MFIALPLLTAFHPGPLHRGGGAESRRMASEVKLHECSCRDGHVFVVHGDVLSLSADAVLVPTRNLNNRKWFPSGPPVEAIQPPPEAFTPDRRVIRVDVATNSRVTASSRPSGSGSATSPHSLAPSIWLGHLDGRFAPDERRLEPKAPPELSWFLEAASQFLDSAHNDLLTRQVPPRCGRAKHVLSMPVIGTGKGGARASSGEMITDLLQLLDEYASSHAVDIALVVKNDRMFSAAQAHRRQLDQHWEHKLGPRLMAASERLAKLAASERLAIFLGAGVSVGAGLPAWQQLITALANRPEVPLAEDEVRQLDTLGLPDQAAVVSSRLGEPGGQAAAEGGAVDDSRTQVDEALNALVVDEISSSELYSITHGLLAGLPISAAVTTNYDSLFERAWRAADKEFNVLPYETEPSERFILKLHGDVNRPLDIVLTRSQMLDSREQRKALAGIVQTMLLTKHLLFVGFSLQDPNFSEVAGTVRRARSRSGAAGGVSGGTGGVGGGSSSSSGERFGTLLTLHNRPFLAELWPELLCLPIDVGDAARSPQQMPNDECARQMEILLDKVSLDSSTTTRHLLDSDFSGVFSPAESALKARLEAFRIRLAANGLARQSTGFAVVQKTLRRLGDRRLLTDDRDDIAADL